MALYVSEGSSTTEGTTEPNDVSYSKLYAAANPRITFHNVATGGSVCVDFVNRAKTVDRYRQTSGVNVLSVQPMSNSIASTGEGEAAMTADLAATIEYLKARRAAGWSIVVCTQAEREDAGYNGYATLINETMRGWVGRYCDAVADFGADPTIGQGSGAGSNPAYIYDGVHPTPLTYGIMLGIIRPILDARFASRKNRRRIKIGS